MAYTRRVPSADHWGAWKRAVVFSKVVGRPSTVKSFDRIEVGVGEERLAVGCPGEVVRLSLSQQTNASIE